MATATKANTYPHVIKSNRPLWWVLVSLVFAAGMVIGHACFKKASLVGNTASAQSKGLRASLRQAAETTLVNAVRAAIRHEAEQQLLDRSDSQSTLIQRFQDPNAPRAQRRLAAWRLARDSDDPAHRKVLLAALAAEAPETRGLAAEAIGRAQWPDALMLLRGLLSETNPVVVTGAIRGLASLESDAAAAALADVLRAEHLSSALRSEAALGLGEMQLPAALEALLKAASEANSGNAIQRDVLLGLGRYPFAQTEAVFRRVIASNHVQAGIRAAALEGLTRSDSEVLPFLLETMNRAPEASLRAAAAWASGQHPETGQLSSELSTALDQETDALVRRRIYEALQQQQDLPIQRLARQGLSEPVLATRIAAANALASALPTVDPTAPEAISFERTAVPELEATALTHPTLNLRMRSVFALSRAGTASAKAALARIATVAEPRTAAVAQRGLERLSEPAPSDTGERTP